ncbi:MAG: flagellar basal body-associated FliL family protein [Candidatus Sedimenticola sp. PURPLELP]
MADKEKKEDLELGEEQEKGSNTKLIIMIAAGVIVLLAGGLGLGWFLFGGSGGDEEGDKSEEVVEEVKAPIIYHPMSPEFIVNLPPGGKVKMLQVEMQLVTRNQETVDFLKHNDPMVRHNLLDLLGSQDGEKLKNRETKEQLQAEVMKKLNKIIKDEEGPGEVEAVYFTAFVTQ